MDHFLIRTLQHSLSLKVLIKISGYLLHVLKEYVLTLKATELSLAVIVLIQEELKVSQIVVALLFMEKNVLLD